MALRVPWDKQETALLIDAYLRVKNKELSQQEAIKEVSLLLRRRAILSGMEIDDVFRNINGITMQMKIIGGLVDDRPSSLHSATKIFNDMVALYKSKPAAFYEILNQAKGECAMQMNVQERFFAWLQERVSSAQLSEFYIVCKDIESFCMNKRILTEPLFETTNTVVIQGVIDTIKSNRMFQFKYFRHLGKMRKVMDYYMTFLREVPLHQSKETEKVHAPNNEMVTHSEEYIEVQNTDTSNTEPVVVDVQDEVTVSVSEEENILAESNAGSIEVATTDEAVAIEDGNSEALVWYFANDNVDFSNTSPTAIAYFDDEEKVRDWADAFVKIVRAMQEDYPAIIRGMVGYRFVGIGKVALTGIAGISSFSKPVELNNGLYLETDCSPDEIVSIVRVLMDKCNMDYDSLLRSDKMTPDEQQVLKTVLLLQAISLRISDVDLLKPNEQNVDLAFSGTGWSKGKARSIAEKLVRDGILFKRTVGGGKSEYTIANSTGDAATIKKLKDTVIRETKTQDLITNADLIGAITLPPAISGRYILNGAAYGNFTPAVAKLAATSHSERFSVLVTFALNDDEAAQVKNQIVNGIKSGKHNFIYVDASLSPMGKDLFEQYIESMAYSRYYAQNDKHRAGEFQKQAAKCLTDWKEKIAGGAFMLYSAEYPSGKRLANITALQDEFSLINHQKYFYGLESYDVKRDLFVGSALAQGAECGVTQTLKQTFKEPKLETALSGAWGVDNYWEDPTKRSLSIVQIKMKVEELIQQGFNSPSGRVCVADIYGELEQAPYGFRATNLAAFVMGFVLKEYATMDYFWSNGSISESMSVDKMKMAIANAMKQTVSPDKKYKPEYIVAMSAEQRAFLKCTSEAFRIPMTQCGSIESARDQIRISMKKLSFPIWSVKSILETVETRTSVATVATVIDDYCGIANTANSSKASESDLADAIGRLVLQNTSLIEDLTRLLTNDMCRKGMLAYIDAYQGGALKTLAAQIGDGGAYLDQVKQKFNADAANWVWNTETANDKINDVILDYRIIAESAKSIPACCSIRDVISGWNNRTNNIKIAFEALKKAAGDLTPFLEELHHMKQTNALSDQNKEKFYSLLVSQREAFDKFYSDQIPYFRTVAEIFIDGMDTDDILKLYQDIPAGQFTKSSTEYMTYVENAVKVFLQNQAKKRLKDLWVEKTGTKDPRDWSARYDTPILCMLDDEERPEAKEIFAILMENSPSEMSITRAIAYLNRVTYFDKLANKELRDKCFMSRVVGDYGLMLDDAQVIRDYLIAHVTVRPYDWMDNSTVQNQIRMLAEKKYKTGGSDKVWAVVEKMDATELRHYLKDLISDNVKVGIEILKNK